MRLRASHSLLVAFAAVLFVPTTSAQSKATNLAQPVGAQQKGSQASGLTKVAPAPERITSPIGAHPPRFKGFVDLHAHPLSYLGFGGKLIHGGLDIGSYLPADSLCVHDTIAKSMQQALGPDNPTHGGWGALDNPCGDTMRRILITKLEKANKAHQAPDWARGFPQHYDKLPLPDGKDFSDWPTWDDIDHQKMWVDSIFRAYTGGLRVMIALAVNNKTLADGVRGPGDRLPDNDRDSGFEQIAETKKFVMRHNAFMEIAYSPSDLERIVRANKMAVVLGVELDNIGGLNRIHPLTDQAVSTIVHDLYNVGVRYVFLIHVLDNPLGGTAIYKEPFNVSNYYETGHYWNIKCSQPSDGVTFRYSTASTFWDDALAAGFELAKLGGVRPSVPMPPACPPNTGHVNSNGLTPMGEYALREMMKLGMLIDIDHMSQKAAERALEIAEGVDPLPNGGHAGYPLFSGHNSIRGKGIGIGADSEIARTVEQYKRIAKLHGMAGVGTGGLQADQFLRLYNLVVHASDGAPAAFGTDTDGLVEGMPRRSGSNVAYTAAFPMSQLGTKKWNYNQDGVAHYGMIADYIKDMESIPGSSGLIDNYLMNGADYFLDSWQKAEVEKVKVK